jgi:hypothetical protein
MTFLVGGLLLILLLFIAIAFVPLVECPYCKGFYPMVTTPSGLEESFLGPCPVCKKNKGKVSILKKWTLQRNSPAR